MSSNNHTYRSNDPSAQEPMPLPQLSRTRSWSYLKSRLKQYSNAHRQSSLNSEVTKSYTNQADIPIEETLGDESHGLHRVIRVPTYREGFIDESTPYQVLEVATQEINGSSDTEEEDHARRDRSGLQHDYVSDQYSCWMQQSKGKGKREIFQRAREVWQWCTKRWKYRQLVKAVKELDLQTTA